MAGLRMDQVFELVLTTQAKGLLLLLVVACAAWAMRRSAAAARHWIWMLGALGLLALPVLSMLAPSWQIPVPVMVVGPSFAQPVLSPQAPELPDRMQLRDRAADVAPATFGTLATLEPPAAVEGPPTLDAPAPLAPLTAPAEPAAPVSRNFPLSFSAGALLLTVWAAGAGLLLLSLAASLLAVTRLGLRSRTFASPRVNELTEAMRQQLGIRTRVRVLEGEPGAMPMSWGLIRPTILLPDGAERWHNGRLVSVLLHELAHVRRRDCLSQVVAEVALALHWLNPLAWVAARRLRIEREHACDDVVLAAGARPSDYAEELISLARGFHPATRAAMAAVTMARPTHLATRIRALFQERARKQSLPHAAAFASVGSILVFGLAAAVPARAHPSSPLADLPSLAPAPFTNEPVADPAEAASAFTSDVALISLLPPQVLSCGMAPAGWDRTMHNSNDDTHRLEWSKPGCDVEIRVEGDIEFSADFRDVARLGRNALVRIEETESGTERRLDVTPDANDAPAYRYRVNGQDRPFAAAAHAWYEGMLLQVFRRAGFMAEERVAALLRAGGTQAVLQELELIPSDYVFATYVSELFRQGDVTDAQAVSLLTGSATRVDSDFYSAQILDAVAQRHLLSDQVLDAFIAGSARIESDHYRAQVLGRALAQATLTPPRVAAVLASASGIGSDHYLAQLLEDVATRYALEPALRESYLSAVESIESDHYQAEVLATLLERNDLGLDELAVVLRAVNGVDSDHYRTTVLQGIAARALTSDGLRSAYIQAAAGIESDHYRTEALSHLLEQPALSDGQLQDLIGAAAGIESDHYKSELLVDIVRRHRLQGATREAFIEAMDTVESQHYRGQVAEALLRSDRGA